MSTDKTILSDASKLEIHPYAAIFPRPNKEEYERLKRDIKENGQLQPIVLYEGKVLDGVTRLSILCELKYPVDSTTYFDDDPLGHVLSLNVHRRHMNESQRALVGARLCTQEKGRPQRKPGNSNDNAQICAFTQDEAAQLLVVSRRLVQLAKKILDSGRDDLVAAIDAREMTVSEAVLLLDKKTEGTKQTDQTEEPKKRKLDTVYDIGRKESNKIVKKVWEELEKNNIEKAKNEFDKLSRMFDEYIEKLINPIP